MTSPSTPAIADDSALGNSRYSLRRWKPVAIDDLVRIGRSKDGGYVISRRCVERSQVVVGFGICDDWSFEDSFIRAKPDVTVVGVDGSVAPEVFRTRSRESLVRAAFAAVRGRFHQAGDELNSSRRWAKISKEFSHFFNGGQRQFRQVFLADLPGQWVQTWEELSTRDPVISRVAPGSHAIFVKMDIEGAEYRVLTDLLSDVGRINGLVVEFHDVDIHWDRFADIMDALSAHFVVSHIHGNNYAPLVKGTNMPRALEISFINRALVPNQLPESTTSYPLANLDRPCDPTQPDYAISF